MLYVGLALKDYAIEASDGRIGTISDLLFDDGTWKIRWLVVDTGSWLSGRKVLLHPSAVGEVDVARQVVAVKLTKQQITDSPSTLEDQPVSQQMQANLYDYYGWDPMWGGAYFGAGALASPLVRTPFNSAGEERNADLQSIRPDDGDPRLRSIAHVTSYHTHASDGTIGHVENFLIDDASWCIRYLVIDTSNWWIGQHVLLSPYAVKNIDWAEREIRLDVSREQVRASPTWGPFDSVDHEYEKRLHTHYNWPGYGW
jgi:hypothetical protein